MIICPNCGKEISEDVVHCGHCGHQIETEQKKTMMGFGAVDPEKLKKDVEDAKKAKSATESDAGSEEKSTPDGGDGGDDVDMGPTKMMDEFKLPKPGKKDDAQEIAGAPTAAMGSVDVEDENKGLAAPDEVEEASSESGGSASVDVEQPAKEKPGASAMAVETAEDSQEDTGGDDEAAAGDEGRIEVTMPDPQPRDEPGAVGDAMAAKDNADGDAPSPSGEIGQELADATGEDSEPELEQEANQAAPADDAGAEGKDGEGDAARASGRDLMQMRSGGRAAPDEAGEAQRSEAGLDTDGESPLDSVGEKEQKSRRRTILIVMAILFAVMGCCMGAAILTYTMGGLESLGVLGIG